jgi:hypothetical protein
MYSVLFDQEKLLRSTQIIVLQSLQQNLYSCFSFLPFWKTFQRLVTMSFR